MIANPAGEGREGSLNYFKQRNRPLLNSQRARFIGDQTNVRPFLEKSGQRDWIFYVPLIDVEISSISKGGRFLRYRNHRFTCHKWITRMYNSSTVEHYGTPLALLVYRDEYNRIEVVHTTDQYPNNNRIFYSINSPLILSLDEWSRCISFPMRKSSSYRELINFKKNLTENFNLVKEDNGTGLLDKLDISLSLLFLSFQDVKTGLTYWHPQQTTSEGCVEEKRVRLSAVLNEGVKRRAIK